MLRLGAGTGGNKVQLPSKGNRDSGGLGCARLGWFQVESSAPQFIQEPKGKKKKRKKIWKMSSVILDPFCNFTASLSEKFPTEITQRAGASSAFTNAVPCSSRPPPGPGADPSHCPAGTSPKHPSPAEHRTALILKPHRHCAEQHTC